MAARPLKILYLMVENTAGTLQMFKEGHERRGNIANYVTLFRSAQDFEEDICLDLPLLPREGWFRRTKEGLIKHRDLYSEASGYPPTWTPGLLSKGFFRSRDALWRPVLKRAFREHGLMDYDIYHLEGGHGFLRMSSWPFDELLSRGKHVMVNYHGADMRTRGVFPWIDKLSELNTTSELDLLQRHPHIEYVFLPFQTDDYRPNFELNNPLRLCHATRDRHWKGSDIIIDACERLVESHGVEFELIENQPHAKTLELKAGCDIYVDQVANLGGWGYGMNSVEAFAMGLVCCTNLTPEYLEFLGDDQPFINVHKETLYEDLVSLIGRQDEIRSMKMRGREWIVKTHDVDAVLDNVYSLYQREGWSVG